MVQGLTKFFKQLSSVIHALTCSLASLKSSLSSSPPSSLLSSSYCLVCDVIIFIMIKTIILKYSYAFDQSISSTLSLSLSSSTLNLVYVQCIKKILYLEELTLFLQMLPLFASLLHTLLLQLEIYYYYYLYYYHYYLYYYHYYYLYYYHYYLYYYHYYYYLYYYHHYHEQLKRDQHYKRLLVAVLRSTGSCRMKSCLLFKYLTCNHAF